MAKPLIIVGAGGFGREVAWLARALPEEWNPIGFLDDDDQKQGTSVSGLPVLGKLADCGRHQDAWTAVAVGSPRSRRAIVDTLGRAAKTRFATLVHPSVHRNKFGSLGEGSLVCAGSLYSDRTFIGRHCIVNAITSIGHDTIIGDFCTLAGHVGVCGNVLIGAGSELGTGVVVVPGVAIGEGCLCCAGSVVANPVAANAMVAGNPARRVSDLPPFPS